MPEDKFIESPPEGREGWREVWSDDRRYPPTGGFLRRLARRFFLLLSGASGEGRRQREFNVAALDLLQDLRGDIEIIRDEIVKDVQGVNADLSRDIGEADQRIHKSVARGDALISALDRKIEALAARLRDQTNPHVPESLPPNAPSSDFHYRRLEDALRGTESEVRGGAKHYLRYATEASPVIDVGCGRGEFLELCNEKEIEAIGFDSNERAVADLQAKGLDARLGLIPGCFVGVADRSVGTVVAMHVVEHLPFAALYSLFIESARVLKPGGYLVVETPNADSLVTSAREFWKDPTHLGPRHQAALVTLAREIGFEVAELTTITPFSEAEQLRVPEGASTELRDLVERLNPLLYGNQNLRLVLRLPTA